MKAKNYSPVSQPKSMFRDFPVLRPSFIFDFAGAAALFDGFFEGDLDDLGRAVGKPAAILGFVVDFGIRALAQVDVVRLRAGGGSETGKQQARE